MTHVGTRPEAPETDAPAGTPEKAAAPEKKAEEAAGKDPAALLREKLAAAVAREDYEEAARLRDEIRDLAPAPDAKKRRKEVSAMAWYEVSGKDSDVVFSSRIRLARNLSGYPFEEGLTTAAAREILNRIGTALGADFTREDLEGAPALRVQSLVEQHEISPAFAAKKTPHALFTDEKRSLYLMGLEEDHIRLQCLLPGLALSDAYRLAREADRETGRAAADRL